MKHQRTVADPTETLLIALEEFGRGGAIVLDQRLRTIGAGPRAIEILGESVQLGAPITKMLCGESLNRPIAEALAAARPIVSIVERPLGRSTQSVLVRATPIGVIGKSTAGWVLTLERQPTADGPESFHGMWTSHPSMKRIFHVIGKVASSDVTVLVRGDSGSGKELVARAIHALSRRAKGPLRAINCAAVPPTLLESELFGHAKGAFTGAVRDNPGHFRLADRGTLFLDEVAEMPPELQAKMLRVLETREILPVGARDPVSVDVRIIAATHRSLRKEVEQGRFRADLMYRLRVIPIFLPPLHARGNDVLLLALKLIEEMNQRSSRKVSHIAPSAAEALVRYAWPGNIRELRNALEYAYAIGEGPVLVSSDLPPELTSNESIDIEASPPVNTSPISSQAGQSKESERILRAIERSSGNRDRAAKILGISRITLWRRMKALGIRA